MNQRNKRLGDFVAGSVVVRESSIRDLKPTWQGTIAAGATTAEPVRVSTESISIEELSLIDAYLNRRDDLAPDVRSRMATDIVARSRPKISAEALSTMSQESLLEALSHERRSSGRFS